MSHCFSACAVLSLVGALCRGGAGRLRAASEPRPPDADHRCDDGPKAGASAKSGNKLWRIHSVFDLPRERFGHFELTDQHGGETLDRIPFVKGDIRIADRAYLQLDRIALVLAQDADVLIRAGWRNARSLDAEASQSIFSLSSASFGLRLIDRPIFIGRKSGKPLALPLVAVKKSGQAAEAARG